MHSIIIIEDHSIVRKGIQSIIEESDQFKIIESYSSGSAGLEGIKKLKPDFAIIDLSLPDLPGDIIIRDVFLSDLKTQIIVLSSQKYIPQISHLLSFKIAAYVVKDNAAEELLEALKQASQGRQYLSPSIEELLVKMGSIREGQYNKQIKESLTERELEVTKMLCQGFKSKEIASKLHISPKTVRTHIGNILDKLKLDSIAEINKIRDILF